MFNNFIKKAVYCFNVDCTSMGLINIIHAYKCIVRIYIYLVNLGYSTGLSVEAWVTILPVPLNRIQNHVRTPKKLIRFEKKITYPMAVRIITCLPHRH